MNIKKPCKFALGIAFTMAMMVHPLFCNASNFGEKVIALTFDDGPSAQYTPEVLDILKKNNIKATFFVTGGSVYNHQEVLKRAFAEGNVIGNHSYSHPNLSKMSDSVIAKELTKTNELIYQTIHVHPVLFRPPYGSCSAQCKKVVSDLGFRKITWSYMVNDWDYKKTTPEIIAASIINHATPGGIMNMHDGGLNKGKTVAALPIIIDTLRKKGYQLVTVPEILKIAAYREES